MNLKDKTYRTLIIASAIFEAGLINAIILSYYFGYYKLRILLIILFVGEIFGLGYKLSKYEKLNLGI